MFPHDKVEKGAIFIQFQCHSKSSADELYSVGRDCGRVAHPQHQPLEGGIVQVSPTVPEPGGDISVFDYNNSVFLYHIPNIHYIPTTTSHSLV